MPPNRFVEGFFKSWGVILASEIGDKTFFIAAVMAMRHPQLTVRPAGCRERMRHIALAWRSHTAPPQVLVGALGALWVMTALSAVMGWAAPALVRRPAAAHV